MPEKAVGDLVQLPPIVASPIFANYQKELLNLCHPWKEFTMIELTEIMRQKDDRIFVELLNRIRIGQCSDEDVQLLRSREISQDSADYPSDALHVWCENGPADTHNASKLTQLNTPEVVSVAQDKFPPNIKQRDIDRVLSQSRSKTGGLEAQLHLKQGARVMLTTNLAIADRLTNGQLGTVTGLKFQQNDPNPLVVYCKFDDKKAGISTIRQSSNQLLMQQMQFPSQRLFQLLRYAQENILLHKLRELSFLCAWRGHAQYTKFKD